MSDVDIPVLGADTLVQPMLILITGSNTYTNCDFPKPTLAMSTKISMNIKTP